MFILHLPINRAYEPSQGRGFPYAGLRDFISRYKDIFDNPNGEVTFPLDMVDYRTGEINSKVDISFQNSKNGDVVIFCDGITDRVVSEFWLNPYKEKAKLVLPQYGTSALIKEGTLKWRNPYSDRKPSREAKRAAAEMLGLYKLVAQGLIDEKGEMKTMLDDELLRHVPADEAYKYN